MVIIDQSRSMYGGGGIFNKMGPAGLNNMIGSIFGLPPKTTQSEADPEAE